MTDLNISTITFMAKTNQKLNEEDLKSIYNSAEIQDYNFQNESGIIQKEYGENMIGTNKKIYNQKRKSDKEKKSFKNQLSFYTSTIDYYDLDYKTFETNKYSYFDKHVIIQFKNKMCFSFNNKKALTPLNEIIVNLNENSKEGDIIKIISSSSKKSLNDYINITHHITDNNIKDKQIVMNLTRKYFVNGLFVLGNNIESCKIKVFNETSIFVFKNENIKICGCKTDEQAIESFNLIPNSGKDIELVKLEKIMINSDFDLGKELNLTEIETKIKRTNLIYNYDIVIHPAINIKYMFNTTYTSNGICSCCERLKKKYNCCGNLKYDSICKGISILIFASGKVLIMGTNSFEQLNEVYNFTKKLFDC